MINVYVPERNSIYGEWIARGSGIVGELDRDRSVLHLDFEGDIRDAVNVETFADRVQVAYSRHRVEYPTKARIIADPQEFTLAGRFDPDEGRVLVDKEEPLQRWLDAEPIPQEELFTTGGHAGQRRKWEKIASETSDPALRLHAKKQAKRYARKQEVEREEHDGESRQR